MISHGQVTNAAFYNYTTLSDLKVISAMLKDVANSWNFKTTLIRINKTVTIDKLPFDFDVILNNTSDLKEFDFEGLATDTDLLKFAIVIEHTLFVTNAPDCLNGYISFLFDNVYAPGKVLTTMAGFNEMSNPYFQTYRYGGAQSIMGSFPVAGAYPSPLMGVVGGKLVMGLFVPNNTKGSVAMHKLGQAISQKSVDVALDLWRGICLNDSVGIIDNAVDKFHPRNDLDLIAPSGSFTGVNSPIFDMLVEYPENSQKNYDRINRYNELLTTIYTEAVKQIEQIET